MPKLWVRRVTALPLVGKAAGLFDRFLQSAAGVKLVNINEFGVQPVWIQRLIYFEKLLELVKDVPGDIVECGVAHGKSLAILALLVREGGETRHLWGFDSFEGLPKPDQKDIGTIPIYAKERMFSEATEASALGNLRSVGLDEDFIKHRVTLVKGWFSNTLPKYAGSNIALLHIDADLYESYKACLNHLWEKVAPGGIIAFDEYNLQRFYPGARKAVDEFFAQRPGAITIHKFPFHDRYYAIKHS